MFTDRNWHTWQITNQWGYQVKPSTRVSDKIKKSKKDSKYIFLRILTIVSV